MSRGNRWLSYALLWLGVAALLYRQGVLIKI